MVTRALVLLLSMTPRPRKPNSYSSHVHSVPRITASRFLGCISGTWYVPGRGRMSGGNAVTGLVALQSLLPPGRLRSLKMRNIHYSVRILGVSGISTI